MGSYTIQFPKARVEKTLGFAKG